jgi:transposase
MARTSRPWGTGPRSPRSSSTSTSGSSCPKKRTAQALAELFGTPVSEGTVARMTIRAAEGLDEFSDVVRDRIAEGGVAGFDETGCGSRGACVGCTAPAPRSTA